MADTDHEAAGDKAEYGPRHAGLHRKDQDRKIEAQRTGCDPRTCRKIQNKKGLRRINHGEQEQSKEQRSAS